MIFILIILVPHKYGANKIIYGTELAYRQILIGLSQFKVSDLWIYVFNLANMVYNLIFQIEIVKVSYLRFLFGFSTKKTGAQQNTQKYTFWFFLLGTTKQMSYKNMLYTGPS